MVGIDITSKTCIQGSRSAMNQNQPDILGSYINKDIWKCSSIYLLKDCLPDEIDNMETKDKFFLGFHWEEQNYLL
jgi:hypothetical protein